MPQTTPLLDGGGGTAGGEPSGGKEGGGDSYLTPRAYGAHDSAGDSVGATVAADAPLAPLGRAHICCILSTAFCFGCTMTTLFLLTLPVECQKIEAWSGARIGKSVALGAFAAVAGAAQLVCPLVGLLSDRYRPLVGKGGNRWIRGNRLPYLLFGTVLTVFGVAGMGAASVAGNYGIYSAVFVVAMVGINVVYCIMIALIPDLVCREQTGQANGTLALLLVSGSLFGFALFKTVLQESVGGMYAMYAWVGVATGALTFFSANGISGKREDVLLMRRRTGSVSVKNIPEEANDKAERSRAKRIMATLAALLSLGLVPTVRKMISEPLALMAWAEVRRAYWVYPADHHDFFVVTISRLFYYLGLSVQVFFLYFIHDVLHERTNPEATASALAMVSTAAGAITCYPVGIISDRYAGGRRKPFVYGACAVLAGSNLALLWCKTIRQMAAICAVLGAANGVYLTMDTSLAVDTLPPEPLDKQHEHEDEILGETDRPRDGAAQLLGIWGVFGFIGSALGPLVGGPLLYCFGSQQGLSADSGNSGEQESSSTLGSYRWEGYAVILSLSACYFACSAVTLRWIRDPRL
jgi:Na+/melibiose symporter-like transporter